LTRARAEALPKGFANSRLLFSAVIDWRRQNHTRYYYGRRIRVAWEWAMFNRILIAACAAALGIGVLTAPAHARHDADEWSSARKTTHHYRHTRHRSAVAGSARQQPGSDVCRRDAVRLCKPVLGQGNMAVLGCFRSHARSLSRGCRGLLQSYGQL